MDAHKRGGQHARFMLEKRQRVTATTSEEDDGVVVVTRVRPATTTVTGRQPLPTTSEEEDADAEETSTTARPARVRTTATTASEDLTSSAPVTLELTRAPLPTTSTAEEETTISTTSSRVRAPLTTTTSSTPSATAVPRTTARLSTSTSASSSAISSGIGSGAASASDTADSSTGGSSHTGAIAGAVIGVLVVAAIAVFFGLKYRKKKQRAAEDAAIFQYGNQPGGGGAAAAIGKGQSAGYNQQIDSVDDLSHGAGYGYQNNGEKEFNEKPVGSGMAGYGTLGLAAAAQHDSFGPRGSAYSASSAALLGPNGAPLQPGGFAGSPHGSMNATAFMNDYPPTPQQGYPQSARGSFASGAQFPQDTGYPMQQQQQQPQMFVNTNAPPQERSPLGMAAGVPLPTSPAGTRQSMNSVAAAAAAAALGGAAVAGAASQQPQQEEEQGPFEDPAYANKVYLVTRIFEPSMPDELVIYPGDRIQIVMSYDDGWCLGCNLDSPKREGGGAPARGVFPRDCVEEIVETDEDKPISSGNGQLQRAPTLPPLDMGNTSRFSMSSNSAAAATAAAAQAAQQQDKRVSKRLSRAQQPNDSETDDEMEDAYGGVASSATPTRSAFPPDIQVQSHDPLPPARPLSYNFGSSQHIADYASGLADDTNNNHKRLSVLQEENEHSGILDEFPSTPRTEASPSMVSQASPAGSAARLSVAGIPKSTSARSIKRTSSLIASKDADLFLALGDSLDQQPKH